MPSLWQRLTGRSRRTPLVCYLRENGPIAYELPLFAGEARAAVEAMLETGLTWYWRPPGGDTGDWTQLSRWSLAAFLADAARPDLLAVGIDPSDAPADASDRTVAGWLRPFAAEQPSPVHAFIHKGPAADRVFVAQQPIEVVRTLLQGWGIDRGSAERRAYAHLRTESLEDLQRRLTAAGQ